MQNVITIKGGDNMTEYGTVVFLLYMTLIGSGLFVWTFGGKRKTNDEVK